MFWGVGGGRVVAEGEGEGEGEGEEGDPNEWES